MKIYGPYKRKDGRFHIIKYENGRRTTQSYPRFLLEQHLGRKLEDWEHVDHIDNNLENNSIDNLQILHQNENTRKFLEYSGKKQSFYHGTCSLCGIEFTKKLSDVTRNRKQGKAGPFCGRTCAGKYSSSPPRS